PGPRAVQAGLLDRPLSRGNADSRRHARQVQDRRRTARTRTWRADGSRSAQCRLAVAERSFRQAARDDHHFLRIADRAGRQGCPATDGGSGDVDRERSRAAGQAPMSPPGRPKGEYRSARLTIDELIGGRRRSGDGDPRRIVLDGEAIDYRLVRAKRRSIGMQIGTEGLTVRASRWVSIRDIEAALRDNATWIVRQLAEWRALRRDGLPDEWKTRPTT